jgi:Kinesin motor domain
VYTDAIGGLLDKLFKGKFLISSRTIGYRVNVRVVGQVTNKLIFCINLGYNVTILAYGQTGSGKTHTMGTNNNGGEEECNRGVIPRAMTDIFQKIESTPTHDFEVTCSFIELYQENLYDLLSNRPREECVLDIREDSNKEIVIPGKF